MRMSWQACAVVEQELAGTKTAAAAAAATAAAALSEAEANIVELRKHRKDDDRKISRVESLLTTEREVDSPCRIQIMACHMRGRRSHGVATLKANTRPLDVCF